MSESKQWKILGIKTQSPGPRYVIDPSDGERFAADSIKIAGNHVGIKGEAEIECQDYALDQPKHGLGVLLIDGADPWVLESDTNQEDWI